MANYADDPGIFLDVDSTTDPVNTPPESIIYDDHLNAPTATSRACWLVAILFATIGCLYMIGPMISPVPINQSACSTPLPVPGLVNLSGASTPLPGYIFMVRDVSSGDVVTLLENKQVILASKDGNRGFDRWICVENKGWLGFQSSLTGKFLDHDHAGRLVGEAEWQQGWENFNIRPTTSGGYFLLMSHWESLWRVGVIKEHGQRRLAKVENGKNDGVVWEFLKVA